MGAFTGTTAYHRAGVTRDFYVTDGVSAVCELEGARWLCDVVSLYAPEIMTRDEFAVVTLEVQGDGSATIRADDGNDPPQEYMRQDVQRTGFTPGVWTFYLERAQRADGTWFAVLLLPSEH
jgi:hypothetical protein